MNYPAYCICCEKVLERDKDDISYPPYGGIYFNSYGNYGSTVFDPMDDGVRLETNVCDECLVKKAKFISLVRGKDARPWVPGEEDKV